MERSSLCRVRCGYLVEKKCNVTKKRYEIAKENDRMKETIRLYVTFIYELFFPLPFAHYTSTLHRSRRLDIYIYILLTMYV